MIKIPTIFKRNPEKMREILNDPHPNCEWVFQGEGVATRKYDGTCVKIENGKYFKRCEVRKEKSAPIDFIEEMEDATTGKRVGWVPVEDIPENKYHTEAFNDSLPDGTYELVGPKIQGNPEEYDHHTLILHDSAERFHNIPRNMDGLREWLRDKDIEGIVFHNPDGRMGKIKKRDFSWRVGPR